MPQLNVLTWNSTGETAPGAQALQSVIAYLVAQGWQPHVIVVQEANQNPGGLIYTMLANLGNAYNQPPAHAQSGGYRGDGYLMLTYAIVQVLNPFARVDLAQDQGLLARINALPYQFRNTAMTQLGAMRMPAGADLGFGGVGVPFMTWHAPRGVGMLLRGSTLRGGADPDAYWFLQNSGAYNRLTAAGPGNLGVIAGDLNVTVAGLNQNTGIIALPEVLPDFDGVSDNLDHILGYQQAGQPAVTFPVSGNYPAPGTHRILMATVSW